MSKCNFQKMNQLAQGGGDIDFSQDYEKVVNAYNHVYSNNFSFINLSLINDWSKTLQAFLEKQNQLLPILVVRMLLLSDPISEAIYRELYLFQELDDMTYPKIAITNPNLKEDIRKEVKCLIENSPQDYNTILEAAYWLHSDIARDTNAKLVSYYNECTHKPTWGGLSYDETEPICMFDTAGDEKSDMQD